MRRAGSDPRTGARELVAINGRDEWRFSLIGDAEKRTITEEEARAAMADVSEI